MAFRQLECLAQGFGGPGRQDGTEAVGRPDGNERIPGGEAPSPRPQFYLTFVARAANLVGEICIVH
jgi:hypothetical protein